MNDSHLNIIHTIKWRVIQLAVCNGLLYKESGMMPCVDDQGLVFTGTPDTVIKDEAKRLSAHNKAFRAIRLSNTILRHNINLRSLEDGFPLN